MRGQSVSAAGLPPGDVAGDNGRLQGVGTACPAQVTGSPERLQPAADLQLVPHGPVLVRQQNRLALSVSAGRRA